MLAATSPSVGVNCSVAILIAVEDAGPYLIILSPCEALISIDGRQCCKRQQHAVVFSLTPFHQAALLTYVEIGQAAYNLKFG